MWAVYQPVGAGGVGQDRLWIVWRGWWNDGDVMLVYTMRLVRGRIAAEDGRRGGLR